MTLESLGWGKRQQASQNFILGVRQFEVLERVLRRVLGRVGSHLSSDPTGLPWLQYFNLRTLSSRFRNVDRILKICGEKLNLSCIFFLRNSFQGFKSPF